MSTIIKIDKKMRTDKHTERLLLNKVDMKKKDKKNRAEGV